MDYGDLIIEQYREDFNVRSINSAGSFDPVRISGPILPKKTAC